MAIKLFKDMKIIENKIIPFGGYLAVNVFGFLFIKKGNKDKVKPNVINHESIHTKQMKELLWIGFYLWYCVEWFVRLFQHGDEYKSISFEREAYDNEKSENYLQERKPYAWWKYVTKKNI